jgi:abequosyltransferase
MYNRLTIGIPTYNRAEYLEFGLGVILNQNDVNLQIVISDNASEDRTVDVVNKYIKLGLNIKYFCWPKNMGADLNFLKVAELADGEFLWFLGSDDLICDGAIAKVLTAINKLKSDIYLCSYFLCDVKMRPYKLERLFKQGLADFKFSLPHQKELNRFFNSAESLAAFFPFLSSIIVSTEKWRMVGDNSKYEGTQYIHMFVMFQVIFSGAELSYLPEPLVKWRSGNDSFAGAGKIVSRYRIDLRAFKIVIDSFLVGRNDLVDAYLKVFRKHHSFSSIARLRMHVKSYSEWVGIKNELISTYNYSCIKLKILDYQVVAMVLDLFFPMMKKTREIMRKILRTRLKIAMNLEAH